MSQQINSEEFLKRSKRLLEAFVYDYLRKSGCVDTAKTYFEEAGLDNWPPEWLTVRQQENVNKIIKERNKRVCSNHVSIKHVMMFKLMCKIHLIMNFMKRGNKGKHVNDKDENENRK